MICTDYLYICDIYINVLTMNWTQLLSGKRFGMEEYHERKHERTDFQRDYDRLIFSSPFRRLQNKTQVFPFREVSLYITDLHIVWKYHA